MEHAAQRREEVGSWADLFATATSLARRLRCIVGRHAAEHGLTEAQLAVLWQCQQAPAPPQGQHELAAALAFSTAQVSTLVEQLRRLGWLEGSRDPIDRRRQCWHATIEGIAVTHRVVHGLETWATVRGLRHDGSLPIALAELLRGLDREPRGAFAPALRVCTPPETGGAGSIPSEDQP